MVSLNLTEFSCVKTYTFPLAFDNNNTYLEKIILREKRALSQFCGCFMLYDINVKIMYPFLTEITSNLQKLLSEKNKLIQEFANAA